MSFLARLKSLKANLPTSQPSKIERRTEPVIGWRSWIVDGKRLRSVVQNTEWPKYQPMKVLDPNWHLDTGGPNGIHALKTLRALLESGYATSLLYSSGEEKKIVVGCVSMWGLVIEGPYGYRSEYAYPLKFVLNPEEDILTAMMLEEEYGVPVEFSDMIPSAKKATGYEGLTGVSPFALGITAQTPGTLIPIPMTATQMKQHQQRQMRMLAQFLASSPPQVNSTSFLTGLISGYNSGK